MDDQNLVVVLDAAANVQTVAVAIATAARVPQSLAGTDTSVIQIVCEAAVQVSSEFCEDGRHTTSLR